MNQKNDIIEELLSEGKCKENPFRMPEGYFDSLADRLSARIAEEEAEAAGTPKRPVWRILKPAITLAAMFALVFGMGYGVLSLTHTLDRGAGSEEVSGYASIDEEIMERSYIRNYLKNGGPAEIEESAEVEEETLVSYLASELSYSDLAEIYAQLY